MSRATRRHVGSDVPGDSGDPGENVDNGDNGDNGDHGDRRDRSEAMERPKRARAMAGKYLALYTYLENRYAGTVVLTFAEIEDLLGFTLPETARLREDWWTHPDPQAARPAYSDSWVLASRTAKPNLSARIVVFERAL
jgi:hypothetical protein